MQGRSRGVLAMTMLSGVSHVSHAADRVADPAVWACTPGWWGQVGRASMAPRHALG